MSGKSDLRRLIPYMWKYRGVFLAGLAAMLITSALHLLDPLIVGHIIDVSVPHKDLHDLTRYALLFVGVVVVAAALGYFQIMLLGKLGLRIITRIKSEVFEHLLKLPVDFFDHNPVGELIARVENDSERVRALFTDISVTIIGNGLFFLGMLGVMFYKNWFITAILLIPFTFIMVMVIIVVRKLSRFYRRVREIYAEVSAVLTEYVQGMEVVQLFNRQALADKILDQKSGAKKKVETQAQYIEYTMWGILGFFMETVFMILVIMLTVPKILTHVITLGTLVVFIQYSGRLFQPLMQIAENINQFQRAFVSLRRIFALLDLPTEAELHSDHTTRPAVFEDRIRFRNLWFSYKPDEWILKNVSFDIPHGARIALVGPSGSGKTTIVSLLCGFYPVTRGEITIDGRNLSEIDLLSWRRHIGLVLQDIYLFPGNIRENVRVYDDRIGEDNLLNALRVVSAEEMVASREAGIDTEIKEQGKNFSQGEKQLLSFARAVVFEPELVILDEATASIDVQTEARIQQAMESVLTGKTAVIVAHRLSTIINADQILYLENGEIIARGTHNELLESCAAYKRLVELQFGPGESEEAE